MGVVEKVWVGVVVAVGVDVSVETGVSVGQTVQVGVIEGLFVGVGDSTGVYEGVPVEVDVKEGEALDRGVGVRVAVEASSAQVTQGPRFGLQPKENSTMPKSPRATAR